jgi:hypothetical protein
LDHKIDNTISFTPWLNPPLTTNGNHRVLVSEEEIKRAMKLIAVTDRWMIEGGTGVDEMSS